jgi:Major capsid protein Gp23
MGALLESGLVGNIGLKHLKVIKEDTINKWDKLGFLEGLKGHMRENVAQLYENQASYLINEASTTSDTGAFETVVFPIVRRVFSKLLANDIVSVQAMNLPIGKLFYFVPNIQSYEVGGTESDSTGIHYAPYGAPDATQTNPNAGYNYNQGKDLYDRFYEGNEPALDPPGLYDYSKGQFSAITNPTTSVVTAQWNNTTYNLDAAGYSATTGNPDSNFRKVLVIMSGFAQAGAGKLIGPDGQPMDNEAFLSDLTIKGVSTNVYTSANTSNPYLFRVVTQRYGKGIVQYGNNNQTLVFPDSLTDGGQYDNICDANGFIYLEVDLQVPVCITCGGSMDGYTGSTFSSSTAANNAFIATYRIYKNLEFEDRIGEVSFDLMSVTVSVTERKLRAQWSPEMAQDVAAFHNIDAEAELTALLSEQVAAEIDREILRDLRKGAAWNLRWDYNGWKRLGGNAQPYTQKDWNQTLITAINQISAQIHKSTLRGGANWIVVSSEISAIFDDLEYFHVSNAAPEQDQYNMGIERVGTLAGRYQVYRDPYFPPNQVLLGHKGTSLLDTGYIYAPYVPLQLTPTMYNPFNFTPIKGIMTRYAKKMVNNRFYGRITVDGVRTFDLRELR